VVLTRLWREGTRRRKAKSGYNHSGWESKVSGQHTPTLGGKMKKSIAYKNFFVERLCDVDDCTLGPLVNEFVFAK